MSLARFVFCIWVVATRLKLCQLVFEIALNSGETSGERGRVRSDGKWNKLDTGWNIRDLQQNTWGKVNSPVGKRFIKSYSTLHYLPFASPLKLHYVNLQRPHTAFTRCYDLLNSGTLKNFSPAHWSTEAKFLPGIIKVNRILMGPGRLVKTQPGPGSAVLLLPLLLPNAVRLHIQAPAK